MFKITYFKKFTFLKYHFSQKSHFQHHIFHKNRILEDKALQKSHFQNINFTEKSHYFQLSNSSEFMDKKCDFAPVCKVFE